MNNRSLIMISTHILYHLKWNNTFWLLVVDLLYNCLLTIIETEVCFEVSRTTVLQNRVSSCGKKVSTRVQVCSCVESALNAVEVAGLQGTITISGWIVEPAEHNDIAYYRTYLHFR